MPKHYNRGMKTIRGSLDVPINGDPVQELVFNYESPDRTRGWEIDGAWIWLSTIKPTAFTWSSDFQATVYASLATDSISGLTGSAAINQVIDCDDNRSCAWHQKQYIGRATEDFIMPTSVGLATGSFLVDLERIVTNELFINAGYMQSSSSGAGTDLKLNYMIVLKEISISPGQSLIQQLKGIGQNVEN